MAVTEDGTPVFEINLTLNPDGSASYTYEQFQPIDNGSGSVASLEVETRLLAESDDSERVIHFRVGASRDVRTVRLGSDLLLDVDPQSRIAGVWLLNVPPFPST